MSGLFEHGYPYTDSHEINLSWVILKVKELAEAWAQVQQDWTDEQAAFANLQSWIENYFNNLNVQTEINVKLDAMVEAGTMSELIAPYVASGLPAEVADQIGAVVASQIGPVVAAQIGAVVADQLPAVAAAAAATEVSTWLAAHINPDTGYVIDDTFTVQGAAADAKAVGDEFTAIKSALSDKADNYNIKLLKNTGVSAHGKISNSNVADLYVCELYGANLITKYKTDCDTVVYAFFVDEPTLDSLSYNNSRTVIANTSEVSDIVVPSHCEWVVFQVQIGSKISVSLPDDYLRVNIIESNIETQGEMISELQDSVYYAESVGITHNSYNHGDIGSEYEVTESNAWRSIKVDASQGDVFKCVCSTAMGNTDLYDWVLFVDSSNTIIDKISGNFYTIASMTFYATCPANTSYIIVNAYKYLDVVNIGVYPRNDAIHKILNTISENNGMISKGEIILPSVIDVAVGTQCVLNWSSIANIQEGDASVYFEVMCDIGRNCERGFIIDADAEDVGTHTITINCRDSYSRKIINTYSGRIVVSNITSIGNNVNVLMIGDSRTTLSSNGTQGESFNEINGRMITATTKSLADSAYVDKVHFIGTYQSVTDSSVKNLAKSGWTLQSVNNEISNSGGITDYVETACGLGEGASLDIVTVMLGVNDLGPWSGNDVNKYNTAIDKINTYMTRIKTLITNVLTAYPSCKFVIVLECTSCANQDGFGYFSSADYRRTSEGEMEQALKVLRKRIISEFDNFAYDANVILSSGGIWCDRLYGFPYVEAHPESRVSVKLVDQFCNFLHPHDDGYKQIADGIYSTLVRLLQ